MGCRRPSGQGGPGPGVQEGGDQAAAFGQTAVAEHVDAGMVAVQPGLSEPSRDLPAAKPPFELSPRDDALLSLGQLENATLCNLHPHRGCGLHLVSHVPILPPRVSHRAHAMPRNPA
jgi:hypothetical protein